MITLNIEDNSIKLLVVKGKHVELAASQPLEPGLVKDGVITDTAAVSQQIKELLAAHGVTETQVIASISGIHSIYRLVSIPRLPDKALAEAAHREMGRVMPVPLLELHTSWQAISVSGMETSLCLVGLPRNTVDAMIETLRQAGLQPKIMDIKPLALARVSDAKDAIIINVQPASFDIVIMTDGVPELLRSLPFPHGKLSAADKVATIKEELDRTINFYNTSHKDDALSANIPAFVSGEPVENLAQQLGYDIKPLPELLSYPEGFDAAEYAANIGLALKQIKSAASQMRGNLNVTPEIYIPRPRPVIEIISWAFVAAAIAVLIPMAFFTYQAFNGTSYLQAQASSFQEQVNAQQGTQGTFEELQLKVDEAKAARVAFQGRLAALQEQRTKVIDDLNQVTSLLPGSMNLFTISYGSKITLSGTAPDEETVLGYARNLRDSDRFAQVIISNMSVIDYNKMQFTLVLR